MPATHRAVDQLTTRRRFRPSVEKLSPAQGKALRDAIGAMATLHDDRGFQHFAGLHGGPPRPFCHHGVRDAAGTFSGAPLFLPWHRAYLHFFELAMQDRVGTVTLAWWDWTSPRSRTHGIPSLYEGQGNPLASQPIAEGFSRPRGVPARTSRDPDIPQNLPTPDQVERILRLNSFTDFSSQLEDQLHNNVHGWVGGAMGSVPTAAFDPIFYAHHTMVDRIWRLWQLRHGRPGPPQSQLGTVLAPFPLTVGQVVDVGALGYDYAGTIATAPGTHP
jgi:tyrosinase